MSDNTVQQAAWLRYALVQMAIRYGGSKQRMAYAEANGRREKAERASRAARRQFAAIQRLAAALTHLAVTR